MKARRTQVITTGCLLLTLQVTMFTPAPLAVHSAGSIPAQTPQRVRFGNVSFDTGKLWTVGDQGNTMMLLPQSSTS